MLDSEKTSKQILSMFRELKEFMSKELKNNNNNVLSRKS